MGLIANLLKKFFKTQNERELARMVPVVNQINELEAEISALTDEELKERALCVKEKIKLSGTSILYIHSPFYDQQLVKDSYLI